MKIKKEIMLRSGEALVLRSLRAQDAEEAIRVCKRAAGETDFMMRYEDEWTITLEKEKEVIRNAENGAKALMLGAFVGGRLVGVGSFQLAHPGDRARHRADMGISILKSHWGKGIGTAMMRALIGAAKTTALEQLELSVVSRNTRAKAMYDRFGFIEYGRHPRAMKYRDGAYDDMILMQLDLRRGL